MPSQTPELNRAQGRRSPNGAGRRSPHKGNRSPNNYLERTTTVTFVDSTGAHYCTKMNRVETSAASRDGGGELCDDFRNSHCELGRQCPKVHVPASYLWRRIEPQEDQATLTYHAGFNVQCYLPDRTRYYTIPSQNIYVTEGAKRYIKLYNNDGDNFKEQCFLCPTLSESGVCTDGLYCPYIHCVTPRYDEFDCIVTHVATAEAVKQYTRMPADFTIPVFQSNSADAAVAYPGSDVLRTVGAVRFEEDQKNGVQPSGRMQHCAHFQNKKMCRLGDGCRFIHVVSVALSTPAVDDGSNGNSPQRSPIAPPMEENTTTEQRNQMAERVANQLLDELGGQGQMPKAAIYPRTNTNSVSPLASLNIPQGNVVLPVASRSPLRSSPVMVPVVHNYSTPQAPPLQQSDKVGRRSPTVRNDPYNSYKPLDPIEQGNA